MGTVWLAHDLTTTRNHSTTTIRGIGAYRGLTLEFQLHWFRSEPKEPELSVEDITITPAAAREQTEWVALIESLRSDIERLRTERTVAAAPPPRAPEAVDLKSKRRTKKAQPIQDEWGFFDPEQCGFAALLAKLEEITETTDDTEVQPPA